MVFDVISTATNSKLSSLNPARNWRLQDSDGDRLLFGDADKIAIETGGSLRPRGSAGSFCAVLHAKSRYSQVSMKEWRDKKEILKSVTRTAVGDAAEEDAD